MSAAGKPEIFRVVSWSNISDRDRRRLLLLDDGFRFALPPLLPGATDRVRFILAIRPRWFIIGRPESTLNIVVRFRAEKRIIPPPAVS